MTICLYLFRFILRNYIAQNAISAAEKGDFSEVIYSSNNKKLIYYSLTHNKLQRNSSHKNCYELI